MSNPSNTAQNALVVRKAAHWLEADQAQLAQFYAQARAHHLEAEATLTSRAAAGVAVVATASAATGVIPVAMGVALSVGAVTTGLFTRLAVQHALKEVQAQATTPQAALAWARQELRGAVNGLRVAVAGSATLAFGFGVAALLAPAAPAAVVYSGAAAVWAGVSFFAARKELPGKRRHQKLLEPPG